MARDGHELTDPLAHLDKSTPLLRFNAPSERTESVAIQPHETKKRRKKKKMHHCLFCTLMSVINPQDADEEK